MELTAVEINMGVAAMQSAEESFGGLHKLVQAVLDRQKYLSDQHVQVAASRSLGMSIALGTLAACATAFALAFGWVLQRRIVSEIQQAVRASQEVASGNLQHAVTSQRSDEIGDLLRSTGYIDLPPVDVPIKSGSPGSRLLDVYLS